MGDIWPYGPPRYTDWLQCYDEMRLLGFSRGNANIMAAIAGAESSYDLAVVNDTPATGDYSVGLYQVNYYGALYAERVGKFGTPAHVAHETVAGQCRNAQQIWAEQGFGAWGSYDDGRYRHFLSGNAPAGPPPSHQLQLPDHAINPPKEDYSATVRLGGKRHTQIGNVFKDGATALSKIKDGNRRG